MIKWTSIPFFRFAIALIVGILAYIFLPYSINYIYPFTISVIFYIVLFFISTNKIFFNSLKPYLGLTAILCLIFFGALLTQVRDDKNDKAHIINSKEQIECYTAVVIENSEERDKTFRAEVRIKKIKTSKGWIDAKGKVLLYNKKENCAPFKYGDILLIKGNPGITQPPANPYEFNYKEYLRFKQIHHTHFIKSTEFIKTDNNPPSEIIAASIWIREEANQVLRKFIHGNDEYKIATALILGIRSTLDNDLKNAYSSTGTMHVLAVSGLHVGLVLGLLIFILRFLKLSRTGKFLLPIILILSLWIYAFITGFSASVLRAVVMFSLFIIAQNLQRNTNIYNTTAFSAFTLLCINPFFIMDVGFQLSYLAVLSIVFFHPMIYPLLKFKNILSDKIWLLTSVSIAAQIATFPLGLYYFHQFPLNFIISNIIAIPLSFGILYSGIALLFTSWLTGLNFILGWITEKGIWLMNNAIFQIEKIPFSVIQRIDMEVPEIICIYLLIILTSIFILNKKLGYFKMISFVMLLFAIIQTTEIIQQKNQKRFITFSIPGHKALGFIKGTKANIVADTLLISNKQKKEYHINPYLIQHGITDVTFQNIDNKNIQQKIYGNDSLYITFFEGKSFLVRKKELMRIPENVLTDFYVEYCNKKPFIAFETSW